MPALEHGAVCTLLGVLLPLVEEHLDIAVGAGDADGSQDALDGVAAAVGGGGGAHQALAAVPEPVVAG